MLAEHDASLLRGDEAVFHRVGHAHADREADDARRAFERVGRAHARFELIGRGRIALERQQAGGQHLRLGLGLEAEQVEHRELAQVVGAHARLRFSV